METNKHLLYTLSAEDVLREQFGSEQIELLAKTLTSVKDSILSDTDDFERWNTSSPDVLNKI